MRETPILLGIPVRNIANRKYFAGLGLPSDFPWPPHYAGSVTAICEYPPHSGLMWLGPRLQEAHKSLTQSGQDHVAVCIMCVARLADPAEITYVKLGQDEATETDQIAESN